MGGTIQTGDPLLHRLRGCEAKSGTIIADIESGRQHGWLRESKLWAWNCTSRKAKGPNQIGSALPKAAVD
jgi:hypothetical protein